MSQVFSPEGEVIPITIIQAHPNAVTLRRLPDRDGYAAVQLALPKKKREGQEEPSEQQNTEPTEYVAQREFLGLLDEGVAELTVAQFTPGEAVEVSGISKGKGFQGVVKRHHFKGGPASHGHTDWERRGGSIGQRFPQHTLKGKRMAGRMGAQRITVKNLHVVLVDPALHLLTVKGAVPGPAGSVVEIRGREEKV
jgi:large subunit ribosomal protein L3